MRLGVSQSDLDDGTHTFEVRARDSAGNVGPAQPFSWSIDTTTPSVAIGSGPATMSNVASPAFGFTVSELATIECKLDSQLFTECDSTTAHLIRGFPTAHTPSRSGPPTG